MSAMSAPNAPERIERSVACGNCGASAVDELDPDHVYCLGCDEVAPPAKVPYVRADRVTPDMIDRAARAIGLCRCEECMEYWRSVAEAALRAALGVEEREVNGE